MASFDKNIASYDSESEYEEEEVIVLVELNGVIDSELLTPNSFEKFKLIGIDSSNPILQINNNVFSGEFSETVGTALFFEEEEKRQRKSDEVFCHAASTRLKYVDKTFKTLKMKRVFISENKDSLAGDKPENSPTKYCKNAS